MSSKPVLLMLYGVKLVDLVDKPVIATDTTVHLIYTIMPEEYRKGMVWPKTTNLKCWECHEIPCGRPYFIPTNYCKQEERSGVYGHFCSVNCAAACIQNKWPEQKAKDLLSALRIVESHFTEFKLFIIPSIPITELKEYKGFLGMTRTEWEQANSAIRAESTCVYRTS